MAAKGTRARSPGPSGGKMTSGLSVDRVEHVVPVVVQYPVLGLVDPRRDGAQDGLGRGLLVAALALAGCEPGSTHDLVLDQARLTSSMLMAQARMQVQNP